MTGMVTILLLAVAALLIPGTINRTRAVLAGRRGVRFFQHVDNARAMLRKGIVTGHTPTLVFRTAPSVYLAAALTASMFIPLGGMEPILSFDGDIVMFAYLLALGRLSLILAALDTGSSFEGMGASREALFGAMVEPAMFIVAGTLALVSGTVSFAHFFVAISGSGLSPEMVIVLLLLIFVMLRVIAVECGRMPVDDPRTHLELTMIHEVMILDHSGIDLAFITVGGWLKTAALAAIAGNIAASVTGGGAWTAFIYTVACGVVIGVNESFSARNKMSRNTTYIFAVVALAFVLFMVTFMLGHNIVIE